MAAPIKPAYRQIADEVILQVGNDDFAMDELADSGVITDDIQGATITHRFSVVGNPIEAAFSQGMGNFLPGDLHPQIDNMYLEQRRFDHLIRSETQADRRTLVTFVYRKRPCMGRFQQTSNTLLVPRPTYWMIEGNDGSALSIVKLIGGLGAPIMIPQPLRQHRRRFPNVSMTWKKTKLIEAEVGRTNPQEFLGNDNGVWLLQNAQINLLYGNPESDSPVNWEIVLTFLGDLERQHKLWWPKTAGDGETLELVKPTQDSQSHKWNLVGAHNTGSVYKVGKIDFETLVPTDATRCTRGQPSGND